VSLPPTILVMVGTDYHPFPRLVTWTDAWFAEQRAGTVECLIQHGTTPPPLHASGRDYLTRADLDDTLRRAAVVVCHGGPSTIVETRRRGLKPIVLPRSGARGEHVDDHQCRFTAAMARRGMIHLVHDEDGLREALAEALRAPLVVSHDDEGCDPSVAAARLGLLVDRLVAARRPRRSLVR
jgi:UDP-N-acetylglucosamine transferase subunit ALG13